MLSCNEQGLWPDNLSEGLDGTGLDALIEHAESCPYHQHLLDQDEEEFLAELRQTSSVLCFDPFAQLRPDVAKDGRTQEMKSPALETDAPQRLSILADNGADPLYDRYRRWSDAVCPLEILQVRCGGSNMGTFDLTRDGGSWRLSVKVGDAPLQFWTTCPQHKDEVLLAVYPIPRHVSELTEASTLSFANGQSLSVLASASGDSDFDVWLHCTFPQPAGVRRNVYNFDSLIEHCSVQAPGSRFFKTSRLLEDIVKLAELRFPMRDLEAARLFNDLPKQKNAGELLAAELDEYRQDAEPLRFSCTLAPDEEPRETQEDELNDSGSFVSQVKNWVACHRTSYVYGSYRRVTKVKRRGFDIEVLPAAECSGGHEHFVRSLPHASKDGICLFVGAGVASVISSELNFGAPDVDVDFESDVVNCTRRGSAAPIFEVLRRIRAYYGRSAPVQNGHRLFMPLGAGRCERLLSQRVWSTVFRDAVNANRWASFEVNLLTLFEKFFGGLVEAEAWGTGPFCDWVESTQASLERTRMTVSLDRVCERCSPHVLGCIGQEELYEAASRISRNAGGGTWEWLSSGNTSAVIPVPSSLPLTSEREGKFNDEVASTDGSEEWP